MQTDELVKRLPDCYRKDKDSNNYKLLELSRTSIQGFEDDNQQLYDMLDIMKAHGKTLDLYGAIYKQKRGALADEQYRVVILQRIAQCFAGCDHDSAIKALAIAFDTDVNEVVIEELETPLEVKVKNLPYKILQTTGITTAIAWKIVKSMLTTTVTLVPLELIGTFEFSDRADEYNEHAGFGDIEQSIGGHLGILAEDNTKVPM